MPVGLRVDGDTYTTIYETTQDLDENLRSAGGGSIAIPVTALNGEPLPTRGELIVRPQALTSYAMWETDETGA